MVMFLHYNYASKLACRCGDPKKTPANIIMYDYVNEVSINMKGIIMSSNAKGNTSDRYLCPEKHNPPPTQN
jgi:hypothetical protein